VLGQADRRADWAGQLGGEESGADAEQDRLALHVHLGEVGGGSLADVGERQVVASIQFGQGHR
jgi:hypothetical protein